MRATVNIEFGSEEIERFVTNVAVHSVAGVLGDVAGDPAAVQGVLTMMHQMFGMVLSQAHTAMRSAPRGRVATPMGYGPPGYGAPIPTGAGPSPYGGIPYPPGAGPQGPSNVRPIAEPATVEHCFSIEETRQNDAGWGCCRCAIPNGLSRTHCRGCGHQRCGAVVTPAPDHPSPPQMPAPEAP